MQYKFTVLFFFLTAFFCADVLAQTVILDEDFSDDDFTNNPTWTDSESKHTVNASNMLQLDAPSESGEAVISTGSTAAYGEWDAYIELGFNPSSNNLSRIYIIADLQDMKGDIDGYFVQIGDTDDEVSLYRQDGNSTTKIVDGTNGLIDANPVTVRIRVTRDIDGNWELFTDPAGGNSYSSQGTVTDNTYAQSEFIGLFSDYTSTRSDLFEYDDIKVTKVNPPLAIQDVTVVDDQTIDVSFNLDVDPATLQTPDFTINPNIGNPDNTSASGNVIQLTFNNPIRGGEYTLNVSDIADNEGNTIDPSTDFKFQIFDSYAQGDIIINEFVYDYPATINEEYIEIRNTSNKYLNLADWQIADNNSISSLGSDPIAIEPDSFLVVSADTTELLNVFGNRAFHQASFPTLNNTTPDAVQLIANNGAKADSLTYNSNWGGTDVALERRSASTLSIYQENWGNSPSADGGTPGLSNEIAPDELSPEFTDIIILSTQTLQVIFDERLGQPGSYDITKNSISSINQTAFNTVELSLGSDLQNAQTYTLAIENTKDIFGNTITPVDSSFTFYDPSPVDSGDVAINEFMAAPPSGSSEYIEIYNHSQKSLDLQGWTLSDARQNQDIITKSQFIVPPDNFAVIAPDNTLESEYPDISLLVMNKFPTLNNGGDQIIIKNNSTKLLDSLAYTSDWGSDEVALERRDIDVAGFYEPNWSESPNGFGTPSRANEVSADTEPPQLRSLTIENSNLLSVTFSERVSQSSVKNASNFMLSSSPAIANISFSAPDSVYLLLDSNLQNAADYTLSIQNVEDIFGNTLTPTDSSFTYYELSPVSMGDIFINEFSYKPSSGSTEYIELHNPTDKSFNLEGWTLSDNRGNNDIITNTQFIVPPDSFAVVAPDNTLLSNYPDIVLVSMANFPSLNNSGDDIVITDGSGTILDSLRYTSGWGGSEVALERRTSTVSSRFQENWSDSPNGFGTPGSSNLVEPDETAPTFEELSAMDQSGFQLKFSERITSTSAGDDANYQISPRRNIQLIAVNDDTVQLFLSQDLSSGTTYDVTVSNISDVFRNTLTEDSKEIEYLEIDQAKPGDIVINEILYNPGSSGRADFIELYNTSTKNFDLTNWVVGDASNTTSIAQNIQLRSGGYIVLTESNILAAKVGSNGYAISGFPSLNNNTPDDIYIRNQNGETIDSLRYYQSWGENTDGSSLERKDPLAASNDASNWQTNSSDNGISAGVLNVVFQEDTTPPEIIFSKVLADGTFEARFSEFIRLTDEVSFYNGDQKLSISTFDSTSANFILLESLTAKSPSSENTNTTLRAENLSDIKGNITQSSEVPVARSMQRGDLVINEIMFNPLANSDDNQPNQTEYIELRNTQDYAISLEGLFLHDEPDENKDIRDIQPVSTTSKWVPPKGHVLIHADENTNFEESQTATFFNLRSPDMQSIIRADRLSLSLASTDDAIYIADSTGATIDSVFYDESWHNPNIIDTRGIALERIAPDGPSDDDSNWGSNVNEKGGTPNSENSIYQENTQVNEDTGISFNPNPFSPDDDGYEDNLFINYKLDQQDYLIKVRIYDRYGRLIRTLADGKQAGFKGKLIWDGRKDDNSRNRIGIYIIVFEAYDSSSGSDLSFKKTVVLARQLN